MAQTLSQIQQQISRLQSEAEKLEKTEVTRVIERIKTAIAAYELTASDLFGNRASSTNGLSKTLAPVKPRKSKSKVSQKAQFADGAGNEWVGRGPRPIWLREALAAGKLLSDFAVKTGRPEAVGSSKAKKKSVAIKYRDRTGKALEHFLV
jgi:DNA-binding protein H-NS